MKNPKEYTKMVNYTYLVTAVVYFTIAAAGYTMFGPNTMQEVKQIRLHNNQVLINIT
jgi:vesicular inhibitory amino acid transporter